MTVFHIVPTIANEPSGPSYSVVRLCEAQIDAAIGVTLAADLPTFSPPIRIRQDFKGTTHDNTRIKKNSRR